ncbi:hypothetical protein [Pseudomonas viridiflava]|uniref:hypothetical protein n=2 Tax=Pseudomonas viridiflava TaxID=33069 RepID=UPI0012DDEFD5|nr:hypothetical protein [Pseudomonas viridiflava]
MKIKSIFEDISIIQSNTGFVGSYEITIGRDVPSGETRLCDGILLRPVAWSWFYLGEHVTLDKTTAEELLAFGESLKPLYTIVVEPCSKKCKA